MWQALRRFFWKYAWMVLATLWIATLLFGLGRWVWLNALETTAENEVRTKVPLLGQEMLRGDAPREGQYRDWMNDNSRIGYVVVANFRTGVRGGLTSAHALSKGAKPVVDFLTVHSDAQALTRLIGKDAGFASQYLDVFSVAILPPSFFGEQTPLGAVKIAYVVPGYPFGRGYKRLWHGILAGVGFFSVIVLFGWASFREVREEPEGKIAVLPSSDTSELDELETALRDEPTVIMDEMGREWRVLFDGKTLETWQAQGQVYISEREIALQPWGASLTHSFFDRPPAYYFQMRARKFAGLDGFLVLFNCAEYDLSWVIGGWRNKWSELVGYTTTRSPLNVERGPWYKLEIRVEHDRLEGWINDQIVWSLPRAEVRSSSPDLGFQKGIGIAAWNTLAKYKELRLLEL